MAQKQFFLVCKEYHLSAFINIEQVVPYRLKARLADIITIPQHVLAHTSSSPPIKKKTFENIFHVNSL